MSEKAFLISTLNRQEQMRIFMREAGKMAKARLMNTPEDYKKLGVDPDRNVGGRNPHHAGSHELGMVVF